MKQRSILVRFEMLSVETTKKKEKRISGCILLRISSGQTNLGRFRWLQPLDRCHARMAWNVPVCPADRKAFDIHFFVLKILLTLMKVLYVFWFHTDCLNPVFSRVNSTKGILHKNVQDDGTAGGCFAGLLLPFARCAPVWSDSGAYGG